jgi:hypothetical protein
MQKREEQRVSEGVVVFDVWWLMVAAGRKVASMLDFGV